VVVLASVTAQRKTQANLVFGCEAQGPPAGNSRPVRLRLRGRGTATDQRQRDFQGTRSASYLRRPRIKSEPKTGRGDTGERSYWRCRGVYQTSKNTQWVGRFHTSPKRTKSVRSPRASTRGAAIRRAGFPTHTAARPVRLRAQDREGHMFSQTGN
jgi:hypothetical protein